MSNKLAAFFLKFVNSKKPLGQNLFEAIAKVSVSVACEAVALRTNANGQTEVFLTERGAGEAYAGQLHCPGSIMRSGESFANVMNRIGAKEYGVQITKFTMKGIISHSHEQRGHVLMLIFAVTLADNSITGKWYVLNELPENVVDFQRSYTLNIAAGHLVPEPYEKGEIKIVQL